MNEDGEGFSQGGEFVGDTVGYAIELERQQMKSCSRAWARHIRMEDMCGVVHFRLECSINVREASCRTAEAHSLAKVVAALFAEVARATADTGFDCDALANFEVGHTRCDGGDDTCSFVTEDKRSADGEVAVPTVAVVVNCIGR